MRNNIKEWTILPLDRGKFYVENANVMVIPQRVIGNKMAIGSESVGTSRATLSQFKMS